MIVVIVAMWCVDCMGTCVGDSASESDCESLFVAGGGGSDDGGTRN